MKEKCLKNIFLAYRVGPSSVSVWIGWWDMIEVTTYIRTSPQKGKCTRPGITNLHMNKSILSFWFVGTLCSLVSRVLATKYEVDTEIIRSVWTSEAVWRRYSYPRNTLLPQFCRSWLRFRYQKKQKGHHPTLEK